MSSGAKVQPRRRIGRPKAEDLVALEAHLIDIGSQFFYEHGYGTTTMSAIAAAASVSKTTLWSRFPSKADLFRAVVARQIESWDTGENHTPIENSESLEKLLRDYGDIVLRAGATPAFVQLQRLTYSESGRFPELAELAHNRFQRGIDYLANYIRVFAERDAVPCRDAHIAAELYLMMLNGWCSTTVLTDRKVSAADRAGWLDVAVTNFLASRLNW